MSDGSSVQAARTLLDDGRFGLHRFDQPLGGGQQGGQRAEEALEALVGLTGNFQRAVVQQRDSRGPRDLGQVEQLGKLRPSLPSPVGGGLAQQRQVER